MVWIKGSEAHTAELIHRFDRAPKPMAYQPAFLDAQWRAYLDDRGCTETQVDPDDFIRYTYASALAHRQPRYEVMAKNWGITVTAEDVAKVRDANDFNDMIEAALAAA